MCSHPLLSCEVDDVVFDLECGMLMRAVWLSFVLFFLAPQLGGAWRLLREKISRAESVLARAKQDGEEELRRKVVEDGVFRHIQPVPWNAWIREICCCCCPCFRPTKTY